ncbi:MAG: thioredoxin-like domain-containing protein, partial [Alphaproteobacteria bacterium]
MTAVTVTWPGERVGHNLGTNRAGNDREGRLMADAVRAPEIDRPGLEWFNVPGPLSLAMLEGKLVILDFWTFCCINCMHMLATLSRIEEAFPEEVAVIGVHSPKFAAERQSSNLAHAIARHDIVHPVVHDPEFQLWREYGVRAWPSLVFISPAGKVIGHFSGEPDPDLLMQSVANAVAQAKEAGTLAPSPPTLEPVTAATGRAEGSNLHFPAKMKPLPARAGRQGERFALADAGHHQVVTFDEEGTEIRRFGSGAAGFEDGEAGASSFDSPQGLCAGDGVIYVADTFNHAIRRIDLESGRVTTCAGTGRRGRPLEGEVAAKKTALASVWDLELDGDRLFFANAGTHQLGELNLNKGTVRSL